MPSFLSNGIRIAYESFGEGPAVLCIHGFASSGRVNWIETGWVTTLTEAGYRAVVLDNRGHGDSQKLYDPQVYWAHLMAEDAGRLLDHLGIARAALIGYSMGARIAAFLASQRPGLVACLVLGGLSDNLVTGLADSEAIISGLTAESLAAVTHPVGRRFRIFAEHTGADRAALAACMMGSREPMPEARVRALAQPALVVVGEADEMVGPAARLAALLPAGEALAIPRRDHMRTTGDPAFKAATLAFLERHWSAHANR